MLDACLEIARDMGYQVRYEWLGGAGGGHCEVGGRKCLFLDLALGPADHLDAVRAALTSEPSLGARSLPAPVDEFLKFGRAA